MKKSVLLQLIKEEIEKELIERKKESILDSGVRKKVTHELIKSGMDGNGRFPTLSYALRICGDVLKSNGLNFANMITADEISGNSGSRTFMIEQNGQEISNSSLFFSWQKFGGVMTGQERKFEVVAYLG